MIFPKTTAEQAIEKAEHLNELAKKVQIDSLNLSFALGHCTRTTTQESIADTLKQADDEMYKHKLFESPSLRSKTINTIITTLHEKNKREEQHSLRVSALCEAMGKSLNLPEKDIKELKTVGLLHDIGKIAIDEKILNKPGKLTEEERCSIQRHPEIGYRILCTVSHMSEMADYVLAHHERWDGRGYPCGLKGEEIPLQSRIIAIADTYDAMVSERSYRSPLTKEQAIEELRVNAGTQFDETLIPIFIEKVLKDFN